MEDILQQIIVFTDKAHGEQMRKYTPERYIVHPVRVMELCREYIDDITMLAAAILHDVLEDTPVGKHEMHSFLLTVMDDAQTARTVQLVEELTDKYVKKRYPKWNRRKRKEKEADRIERTSADAQTIKYADIIDNSPEIAQHDPDFGKLFLMECRSLLKRMTKGHPELYKRAIAAVNMSLQQLKHVR